MFMSAPQRTIIKHLFIMDVSNEYIGFVPAKVHSSEAPLKKSS